MMADGGAPSPERAQQARETLALTNRYQNTPLVLTDEVVAQKLSVHPPGRHLPVTFVADVKKADEHELNSCIKAENSCDVWLGDLNGDAVEELVLFHSTMYWPAKLFIYTQGAWHAQGELSSVNSFVPKKPAKPAQLDSAQAVPPKWKDLLIGDVRWRL